MSILFQRQSAVDTLMETTDVKQIIDMFYIA